MYFRYILYGQAIAFLFTLSLITLSGCRDKTGEVPTSIPEKVSDARFTLMSPQETGVGFVNKMREDYNYNNFVFEYMYNGGGVAAGDVNGDSLPDLYFSSSLFSNKLYLNLGNFKFMDVTEMSGVGGASGFKTGVAMADINGDGRLDLYSCRTSKADDGMKNDFVFINTGTQEKNGIAIPRFEDQSKKLGLADNSNSNHSCFFDYDRDGDLDLFLLNHKMGFIEANKLRVKEMEDGTRVRYTAPETPFESNRMYQNNNGTFSDVTTRAGMVSSTFGLSATAADLNQDGWMDLYVANDYIEPDFIYINNKDGTFTDKYKQYLKHSCQSSMGSDIADFNNDGLPDIIVLDMKPEDPFRYKSLMNMMQYDRYNLLVQHGYGRQAGRNVLQLNNGNGTFSEIGQYAGVATTDWSWGSLLVDFDNDGWKDIYIANGYRKDVTQLDYLNYFRDSIARTGGLSTERYPNIEEFLKFLPEQKIANYLFLNDKDLTFSDVTRSAGMDQLSFSNGTAYADLDRDGDLDIIVNNIDDPAFIYRNDSKNKNWLQIDVWMDKGNTEGIGAAADVYADGNHQYAMMITSKGFFSTSEPIMHFGLGTAAVIDSVLFTWPDGSKEILKSVKPNQRLIWRKGTGVAYRSGPKTPAKPLFTNASTLPGWIHQENDFIDFKRERLMPYMLSYEGPCMAVGDVNGDKLEDIYAGNGSGFPAALYLQQAGNSFVPAGVPAFQQDAVHEDCGAQFGDYDADGDLDLMVISGGNSFNPNDLEYMARYYVNDGKGSFGRAANFPIVRTNAGAILSVDADQDNDLDVFIGGRCTPGAFPKAPKSYFLRNNQGRFQDATAEVFPELDALGMITDIASADFDGDGKIEIIVAGEWMPISIFSFDGKKWTNLTKAYGLDKTSGWWKSLAIEDIDGDGDTDIVAGNLGQNNRLHTSEQYPVTLVSNDFDGNGSLDPIMCFYHQQKLYPFAGRDAIIGQIPRLKKDFLRYTPYAKASLADIFSKDELNKSSYLYAYTFQNTVFRNDQKRFVSVTLPPQAQLSPAYDIIIRDFDGDGRKDILMAGNFIYAETETGELDAGNGTLLIQKQDGSFEYVHNMQHGFWAQGEVRELKLIHLANGREAILTGNNKGPIEINIVSK